MKTKTSDISAHPCSSCPDEAPAPAAQASQDPASRGTGLEVEGH